MDNRKRKPRPPEHGPLDRSNANAWRGTALVVDRSPAARRLVHDTLTALAWRCDSAATLAEATRALEVAEYDVVLIDPDLKDGVGLDVIDRLTFAGRATRVIVLSKRGGAEPAIDAMRRGAADFILKPLDAALIASRAEAAAFAAREARRAPRRPEPSEAPRRAKRRDTGLLNGALDAPIPNPGHDPGDEFDHDAPAAEASAFRAIIRAELDVEALLRRTLEFVLKRLGSTNAAIFLPTGHDEYSLGAYVNCDIPKHAVDLLLDHLADRLPARLAGDDHPARPIDEAQLLDLVGEENAWLAGSALAAFACRHEGECLAVVALFRDGAQPFPAELDDTIRLLQRDFSAQMAKVIKIHHRHRPGGQRGNAGFEVDGWREDDGLAA